MSFRQFTLFALALTAPAWAQQTRRAVSLEDVAEPAGGETRRVRLTARPAAGELKAGARTASADALPQAPGVVQFNLFDASHVVWFVTTERIPRGSVLTPYILLPGDVEIPLEPWRLTSDLPAGESLDLPNIRRFSDFWPAGLLTFAMIVTLGGQDTQAAGDFTVGAKRTYEAVGKMIPRITGAVQSLQEGNVLVTIKGTFTTDPPHVVFEDVVVPRNAMQASASEIVVNLSKVPGMTLDALQESLLTVGQSGWSDTYVFRYLPPEPGTYTPAPALR